MGRWMHTRYKFVAVSIVTIDGYLENKFVSSEAPVGRGADGMLEAVKNSFDNLGWNWTLQSQNYAGLQQMVKVQIQEWLEVYGLNYKLKLI